MHTFPIKVHYKVIEILAVRWLGTKLMQIFKTTTRSTSDASYLGGRQSQYHHINCTGGLVRSENEGRILYTVEKRLSKCAYLERIRCRATQGEIYFPFFSSATHGTAWPLHFKFASYAYDVHGLYVVPQTVYCTCV